MKLIDKYAHQTQYLSIKLFQIVKKNVYIIFIKMVSSVNMTDHYKKSNVTRRIVSSAIRSWCGICCGDYPYHESDTSPQQYT